MRLAGIAQFALGAALPISRRRRLNWIDALLRLRRALRALPRPDAGRIALQAAIAGALLGACGNAQALPLVLAVVASAAGAAAAGALHFLAGTFAYSAVSAAVSFGVTALVGGLLGNDSGARDNTDGAGSFGAETRGRMQVVRSSVASRTIVYGTVMVSGPLVYAEITGSDNSYLHMVVPLANHEITAIDEVYLNDIKLGGTDSQGNVNEGHYSGRVIIAKMLGQSNQPTVSWLLAHSAGKWGSAHTLSGVAYLYIRLWWDQDVFPGGIPNIKCKIRGKPVYDPRTGLTAFSNNWALCVRDYLRTDELDGGFGANADEVDDTQIAAAANVCDELVTLADASTQARYTCDGTVDTARRPRDIISDLMSAAAGVLTYPNGVFRVNPGAYTVPTVTLTESDLRGRISLTPRLARRDLFNAVKGTYSSPDNFWQSSDFPMVTNATYEANDGGERIVRDVVLPFTTNAIRAQRIAKINLEKSRQGMVLEMPCNLRQAFGLALYDTVMVTIGRFGFSAKVFRVVRWSLAADGLGVNLTLREESAASYDWASGDATTVDPAPDTNLGSPFQVGAPGTPSAIETLYESSGSAGVKSRVTVSWGASTSAFADAYALEVKPAADTTWAAFPWQTDTSMVLNDVTAGSYSLRVRARSSIGVRSPYSATSTFEVRGLTAPPADATGFSVHASNGYALASWDLATDLDVRLGGRAVVRHSSLTSGATWGDGMILEAFAGSSVSGVLPLVTGTYMLKFLDSSNNYSLNAVSFTLTEGMISGLTTVATITESTTFPGSKTNVAVVSSTLRLDSGTQIDSVADFDAIASLDELGTVSPTGTYLFNTVYDGTTVATRRFEADISVTSFDTGDSVDARGYVDDWSAVDGSIVDDCDVTLYAAITNDNPAGSPTWGAWTPFVVADFNCRAAKFKVEFESGAPTHNISISTLEVDVKTP